MRIERRVRWAALSMCLAWGFAFAPVYAVQQPIPSRRVALVVGNDSYKGDLSPLVNGRRDARAVASLLQAEMGFAITRVEDVSTRAFQQAVDAFLATVRPGDLALVYYAGHGLASEEEQTNYLIPIDFVFKDRASLPYDAVSARLLLHRLQERTDRVVLILDACRTRPTWTRGARSLARTGLSGMGASADSGAVVAYATQLDGIASDEPSGTNSLFTKHLLRELAVPNRTLVEALTVTSDAVRAEAAARKQVQVPWMEVSGSVGRTVLKVGKTVSPSLGTLSRLLMRADVPVVVKIDGGADVNIAAGGQFVTDLIAGQHTIHYRTSDGALNESQTVTTVAGEQRLLDLVLSVRVREMLGQRARNQFEAFLTESSRDVRSELASALEELRRTGAIRSGDEERARAAASAWFDLEICNGGTIDNRAVGPFETTGYYWDLKVDGRSLSEYSFSTRRLECGSIGVRRGAHVLTFEFDMEFEKAGFDHVLCRASFTATAEQPRLHIYLKLGRQGDDGIIEQCSLVTTPHRK